jgi:D-arabinose 1-dehydrogenase-like Zn-dependent alcohol dehydrogenase
MSGSMTLNLGSMQTLEVMAMARNGRIHMETTEFPLEQTVAVSDQLKVGHSTGRAVWIPEDA